MREKLCWCGRWEANLLESFGEGAWSDAAGSGRVEDLEAGAQGV